jgi:hypothetical protein
VRKSVSRQMLSIYDSLSSGCRDAVFSGKACNHVCQLLDHIVEPIILPLQARSHPLVGVGRPKDRSTEPQKPTIGTPTMRFPNFALSYVTFLSCTQRGFRTDAYPTLGASQARLSRRWSWHSCDTFPKLLLPRPAGYSIRVDNNRIIKDSRLSLHAHYGDSPNASPRLRLPSLPFKHRHEFSACPEFFLNLTVELPLLQISSAIYSPRDKKISKDGQTDISNKN